MARRRGNGEGGISRRKDGRWEGRYTVDALSGRERRSVYGKTRKEVAQRLMQAIVTKDVAAHRAVPGITVRGFLVQYEDAIRDAVKRRSLETYQDIARLHLIPAFGSTKLKNLTREQVQKMYSEKRDGGLSAARVRRIHGVLSSALNCAVRWRLIGHNVCKEVNPPRVPLNPSHVICRSFKPTLKRADLPDTTFHAATRHTFCCLALQQGVNAKTISTAMGHSSVAFTLQRYAALVPNYGDTAEAMDEVLNR